MAVVTLIVMEPGSAWPGHVGDQESLVAVGNDDQEGLLARTRRGIHSILQRGHHVRVAVLACNAAAVESIALRAEVARELLTAVAAAGFGKLVLTASCGISMRERCELLRLAGELSQDLRGSTVSVRFGDPGRRDVGPKDGAGGEVLAPASRDEAHAESA